MANTGIIRTAITKQLPLELDYRLAAIPAASSEPSGYGPEPFDYTTAQFQEEFAQLLDTI